ncbi:nitroreductase/quinone reductase family protein [Actinacidiphila sp. bgisy160]|uniref:nitroreductase/quinone reductase family protein n=1 Tax=Actinacidiphila sp. bgisy160 TaxID=3413796 RepID=UPI003D761D96
MFVPAVARFVHRATRGRVLPSAWLLPGVALTSTGVRGGPPRCAPPACMREEGGTFVLVGSNVGGTDHPAWTGDPLRHPDVEVSRRAAGTSPYGPRCRRARGASRCGRRWWSSGPRTRPMRGARSGGSGCSGSSPGNRAVARPCGRGAKSPERTTRAPGPATSPEDR